MSPIPLFMDSLKAPLNPCSVETIPEPVKLANGQQVWPTIISCYQLVESQGQLSSTGSRRVGQMDLHLIGVPDIRSDKNSLPLKFDQQPKVLISPRTIKSSGVLDGQWNSLPSVNQQQSWCFASAHATGEIQIRSFQVPTSLGTSEPALLESEPLYTTQLIGKSNTSRPSGEHGIAPLCLSLRWDSSAPYKQSRIRNRPTDQLVSTYSNGTVSVYDVAFSRVKSVSLSGGAGKEEWNAHLVEKDSFVAHKMFTNPAEVWSACFAHPQQQRDILLTAGDEGSLKLWDLRSTLRPMQSLKNTDVFEAGVTCVSPHPKYEYIVAVGSYDQYVSIFDLRYISTHPKPLCRTQEPLGGGIWRLKWHPYTSHRLLIAAMHGGCFVVNFRGLAEYCQDTSVAPALSSSLLETPDTYRYSISPKCKKKFSEHESMAYGADWLVCPHPTQNGHFEAAASCSFYDRAVFLWDTIF